MRQLKITPSLTSRTDESFNRYLNDIARIDMITPEEELELCKRIQKGDQRALNRLVTANLRFVVSVAKQYQHFGMSLPDLVEEGNLGLIRAAQKFDATKGFKFISYAVWWIRQRIQQSITDNSRLIRLPSNRVGMLTKINKAVDRLQQRLERMPDTMEIAKELDTTQEEIEGMLRSNTRSTSLDAPVKTDEPGTFKDITPDEEAEDVDARLQIESLGIDLERAMRKLNFKEIKIIQMAFGIGYNNPKSLNEIGESLGMSSERARQIKNKALKKLRRHASLRLLQEHLAESA